MKVCLYTNCQGDGIVHFLRKTSLAKDCRFVVYHNWQLIMGEQRPENLIQDAMDCDAFVYQPTPSVKHGVLSTEDMIEKVVPSKALKISFAYWYNHGFFPIIKHPAGWITGRAVETLARPWTTCDHTRSAYRNQFFQAYNSGGMHFDCARRFAECLAEQSRREQSCDVKLVPFILERFQEERLFLVENHPASPLLREGARQIADLLTSWSPPELMPSAHYPENDAAIPGGCYPIHPAAVDELGLKYGAGSDYDWYRAVLEEYFDSHGISVK